MGLSLCVRCGAKLEPESKNNYCKKCCEEGRYRLYRDAFKAKRTIYVAGSRK